MMNPIKKIIYNCKEATFLIEKKEISGLTLTETLKLKIHLIGCSVCRLFQQQSRMINRLLKGLLHTAAGHPEKLDDAFKNRLKEQINEKLSKDE